MTDHPTNRWWKWARMYEVFARDWNACCDFSEESAQQMFSYESTGTPLVDYARLQPNGQFNGYAVGKHWMDVSIAGWFEEIQKGNLAKAELYEDPGFPQWFLDHVLEDLPHGDTTWGLTKP